MKILVVGGGGREHALAWKIRQSPQVTRLYAAPGNAGIAEIAACVPIGAEDVGALADFADEKAVDLTVVGPEAPLVAGLCDRFRERALLVLGPSASAARLEASKAFTKDVLARAGAPTAGFGRFEDAAEAKAWVRDRGRPVVVKADGLAAGKGVIVCSTVEEAEAAIDECLVDQRFGSAGATVVVEDRLDGEEASFIALTDGETVVPFPTSQDHKRLLDGDEGPNTGGMGAYSPAPIVTPALEATVLDRVIHPTLSVLREDGSPFQGILYAGLMIDGETPNVLEYNVRFGDPECQPILMRLQSDLVPLLKAMADGREMGEELRWDPRPAVCVVVASGGYPGSYEKGKVIEGLAEAQALEDVEVFHAGTARDGDRVVTAGGRVLGVTALGDTLKDAVDRAYEAVDKIHFEGMQYRRDIAHRALG